MRVLVWGLGKVGRALTSALRAGGLAATGRAYREGLPRALSADFVWIAARDADLPEAAATLADKLARRSVEERSSRAKAVVVAHASGIQPAGVLEPLARDHIVAQMHPLASFASITAAPDLGGVGLVVTGDPRALPTAKKVARALAMRVVAPTSLDAARYHAGAALLSNGAAALAGAARELLVAAGIPAADATPILGALLGTVAENLQRVGLPAALTGPVRRGDAAAVARHFDTMEARTAALYAAVVMAQLPLAAEIGEASPEALTAIEGALSVRASGSR